MLVAKTAAKHALARKNVANVQDKNPKFKSRF
jgi:hypothetical protein